MPLLVVFGKARLFLCKSIWKLLSIWNLLLRVSEDILSCFADDICVVAAIYTIFFVFLFLSKLFASVCWAAFPSIF